MVTFSQVFKAEPSIFSLPTSVKALVSSPWTWHRMQRACCKVLGGHLLLVFWLGAVLGIMALLVAVIARDFGSIPPDGTVPTSPL